MTPLMELSTCWPHAAGGYRQPDLAMYTHKTRPCHIDVVFAVALIAVICIQMHSLWSCIECMSSWVASIYSSNCSCILSHMLPKWDGVMHAFVMTSWAPCVLHALYSQWQLACRQCVSPEE